MTVPLDPDTREDMREAAQPCRLCGDAIGYDEDHHTLGDGYPAGQAHDVCLPPCRYCGDPVTARHVVKIDARDSAPTIPVCDDCHPRNEASP